MTEFENTPNLNNPEINPADKVQADVNIGRKLNGELTPEELEKLKVEEGPEQKAEEPELTLEEQLKNLEYSIKVRQQEMARLNESIEGTKSKINEARENLGLPPTEEDTPSVFDNKDQLEKLKSEQEGLKKQKEMLISQQEKERLIREEKEKILQEKIDELFKGFEKLNPRDLESISMSGKTQEGKNVVSRGMGELNPEMAKPLAKAFKEGVKLLPKILEVFPDLMKKFDKNLTKEAIERVDKKLDAEKQKLEEENKNEEKPEEPKSKEKKPEVSEEGIPSGKVKPEIYPESGNIEVPKA